MWVNMRRRLVFVRAYPCLRDGLTVWVKAHFRPISYRDDPDQLVFAF